MARLVRAGHTAQLVRAVSRIHWGDSPIAIHVYRGGTSEPPSSELIDPNIKCVTGYKGIPYGVYILSRFGELLHQLATRLHARSSDSNKNCYAAITLKVKLFGIDLQGMVPLLVLLLMPVTRLTVIVFKEFITSKQREKRYVWDVTVHSTLHHPHVRFKRKCDKFPKSLVALLIGWRTGGTNTIRFAV